MNLIDALAVDGKATLPNSSTYIDKNDRLLVGTAIRQDWQPYKENGRSEMDRQDRMSKWEEGNIFDIAYQFIDEYKSTVIEHLINERPPKFQEYLNNKMEVAFEGGE